jgi:uncharacterized damage-inducible protein DinB
MDVATLRSLYGYHHWVNDLLLDVVEKVSPQQLHEKFGASFDTIHGTLIHLLGAEEIWLSRWEARPPERPDAEKLADVPAIRQAFQASRQKLNSFIDGLTEERLNSSPRLGLSDGSTFEIPLWQSILQVLNHGTHHRSELCEMLTRCGQPPPPTDLLVYYRQSAAK